MADVTGPIRTKPGSRHAVPEGMLCDGYNVEGEHEVLAVARVQGETDSHGSEMCDYCQACLDKMLAEEEAYRNEPKCCEWCKQSKPDCIPTRDFNEGDTGPIYDVCGGCRAKQNAEATEELEHYRQQDEDREHDAQCERDRND